ncbi:MAG TPA: class I SAM-dependent methyltransferase [Anaerolineales bacterium]|nr:class I SAM-dependent methyltransferase [Anaerolineales bacterium]
MTGNFDKSDASYWDEYYEKMQEREPRQVLLDVLEKYPTGDSLRAIDLGCGEGTETLILLAHGWHVLAIDADRGGIKRLLDKAPQESRNRLETQVSKFEDVRLPAVDLIHASYSLPFCDPEGFAVLWEKISNALKSGGRFAGNFFGVNDTWAYRKDMTFHTEDQVRAMFADFEIESFHEQDEDGEATTGPKHWHVFTVIAKKI